MAPQRKALTKLVVERTEPDPTRDVFVWDSKVPGFGVRIYPTGKRMYVFQYRTMTRQQRRIAIGLHGPPHSSYCAKTPPTLPPTFMKRYEKAMTPPKSRRETRAACLTRSRR